jgi:hypothetical protein
MSNSFQITFTNPSKNTNGGITVPEQQGVPVSNLTLIGRNYPGYGQAINQNFLALLENSANPTAPANGVEGQLWYDSYNQVLKVNDAVTGWVPVNGLYEQAPDAVGNGPSTAKAGDIWVDTANFLLYINNGSLSTNPWVLVGPNTSSGTKTGAYPTSLIDKANPKITHDVIIMYIDDVAVEIVSKDAFTPQTVIPGFVNLSIGVNVSALINGATPIVNGIASAAAALRQTTISGQTQIVSANSFVRNDTAQSVINGQLTIANDEGLRIGTTTSTFVIQKNKGRALFSNIADLGRFDFQTYAQNSPLLALTIDGTQVNSAIPSQVYPRIGINNANPTSELDVTGTAHISKKLKVSFDPRDQIHSTQALLVGGDTYLQGNLVITNSLIVGSTTATSNLFNGTSTFSSNILVTTSSTAIGSLTMPVGTVYAQYIGTATSSYTTQFTGILNGPATRLYYQNQFNLNGPISSNSVQFSGSQNNPVSLTTTVTNAIIDTLNPYPGINGGAPSASNLQKTADPSDLLMVYSSVNGTANNRIYNISKQNFLGDIYPGLAPTGSMLLNASNILPPGWVWCDGQRYSRVGPTTAALYNVIGTTYGTITSADFLVPNLNGANSAGGYSLYTTTATGTAGVSVPAVGIKYMIKL